jgi:hypothetical protein
VQTRHGKAKHVADIVESRRGFQEIGISAENVCPAACPRGDAVDVRPAAGQGLLQECLGEMSERARPRLDSRGGTFMDLARRLKPSG